MLIGLIDDITFKNSPFLSWTVFDINPMYVDIDEFIDLVVGNINEEDVPEEYLDPNVACTLVDSDDIVANDLELAYYTMEEEFGMDFSMKKFLEELSLPCDYIFYVSDVLDYGEVY